MVNVTGIAENIENVKRRIEKSAEKAGNDPTVIRIVAVTKTHPTEKVLEAVAAGIIDIGENKLQEALKKFASIYAEEPEFSAVKHFIGHLQTNKAKKAVELFDIIESIDSVKVAEAVSLEAEKLAKSMDILVQVNTSGEESKFGIKPENTIDMIKKIADLPNLNIRGLMTIGIFSEDLHKVRSCSTLLKSLSNEIAELNIPGVKMDYLSMGMTGDFEIAVEEGANLVRLGTAIFGPRN